MKLLIAATLITVFSIEVLAQINADGSEVAEVFKCQPIQNQYLTFRDEEDLNRIKVDEAGLNSKNSIEKFSFISDIVAQNPADVPLSDNSRMSWLSRVRIRSSLGYPVTVDYVFYFKDTLRFNKLSLSSMVGETSLFLTRRCFSTQLPMCKASSVDFCTSSLPCYHSTVKFLERVGDQVKFEIVRPSQATVEQSLEDIKKRSKSKLPEKNPAEVSIITCSKTNTQHF